MTYLIFIALLAVVALFIKWPELFAGLYDAFDIPLPMTKEDEVRDER